MSIEFDCAITEADKIWSESSDILKPPPLGYVMYDSASRKIVHERTLNRPDPALATKPKPRTVQARRRLPFWRSQAR